MKKIVLLSALLAISGALTAQEVQGPDGALKVNVELKDGSPVYSVHYNNKTFLEPSPLGFIVLCLYFRVQIHILFDGVTLHERVGHEISHSTPQNLRRLVQ